MFVYESFNGISKRKNKHRRSRRGKAARKGGGREQRIAFYTTYKYIYECVCSLIDDAIALIFFLEQTRMIILD